MNKKGYCKQNGIPTPNSPIEIETFTVWQDPTIEEYKQLIKNWKEKYYQMKDEIDKYKETLDKIKEYCNNRLNYYQEMRTDYMKEFDGYAENDNENILELLEEIDE